MDLIGNVVAGLFLIVGAGFCLVAAIGLIRLPDVYTRMHAASKAGTLGSCLLLIVAGLHSLDASVAARALAGFVFFLLTAPVSAHLIARAALYRGYEPSRITWVNEIAAREPEFRQGLPPNVQKSAENQTGDRRVDSPR